MRFCAKCGKEAWYSVYDVPLCIDHRDEQLEPDLSKHGRTCECRGCEEWEQWLVRFEAGLLDPETPEPKINRFAEVEVQF